MGGSDEPSNLIELTIEKHAEAHKKLWREHGHWQDEVAWKALDGQINMKEASKIAIKLGAKTGGQIAKNTGQIKIAQKSAVEKLRNDNFTHIKNLGKIQGKINAENGHLNRVCNSQIRSLGGKNASKISNRKIISLNDGKITTWSNRGLHEKKTGIKHNWKNYEERI
jgi:hypothetical protein